MRLIPILFSAGLLGLVAACNGEELQPVEDLPGDEREVRTVPADDDGTELLAAIDEGLTTKGKGPDQFYFVVLRAIDRHDTRLPETAFTFVVGAGVKMPAGAIRVRRLWTNSGQFDGRNEQLETHGVSVGVERGAPMPFGKEVVDAVGRICEQLAKRIDLHPDCVVSVQQAPFARKHAVDPHERALALAVRQRVPVPEVDGTLKVGDIDVSFEKRDTTGGRYVGMMLRSRFDGPNRGMLFIYPHRAMRNFWMRNCLIDMDLAYIKKGKIEQIVTMKAVPGDYVGDLRRHESITPVRYALEMPAGWFEKNGIKVGETVTGIPE